VKIIITVMLTIGLLACLAGMQNAQDQDVAALRQQIADLSLRASRLEHAAGATPGAVDKSSSDASADNVPRSMVVAGIQPAPARPNHQEEIQDLRSDADALQNTVNLHMDNEQRAASRTYARSGYYRDHHYAHRSSNYGREREEMSQREMADRYATLAAVKRQKADRLEQAAAEPGQIIHGHDGDVIFTLRTKYSLSTELENISIGDTITWAGTRVSADGDSETWEVSSTRKLD
jgi:hypothetical protein